MPRRVPALVLSALAVLVVWVVGAGPAAAAPAPGATTVGATTVGGSAAGHAVGTAAGPAAARAAGRAAGTAALARAPAPLSSRGCTGVPDSWFGADFFPACAAHDRCYSPASSTARRACDQALYEDLAASCRRSFGRHDPLRYGCLVQARIYHRGVRLLGRSHYAGTGDPA